MNNTLQDICPHFAKISNFGKVKTRYIISSPYLYFITIYSSFIARPLFVLCSSIFHLCVITFPLFEGVRGRFPSSFLYLPVRLAPSFVRLLFVFCSSFVRLLFVICSSFVRLLFVFCSSFVRLLFVFCSSFVRLLFVISSSFVRHFFVLFLSARAARTVFCSSRTVFSINSL